ncbi:MAG: LptF/LptG family permease [Akkermansia sp.]|nr:LptF/LptG family permease [Akkermansia sp.]
MVKEAMQRMMPALVLFVLGSVLALWLVPIELEQMKWEVPGMPDSYPVEQMCRPVFLALLCFLPFLGAVGYAFMGTMDRYMSRNFISYFLMCTLILLLIYILADFTDNMERFRSRFDDPVIQALRFYGSQLPMFLYQILPYTLMMGTMWCLSKLSGTCEITGMMQSGRSLLRLCMPVFFFAVIVSMVYGIFGFHWAPNGSMYRQMILKQAKREDGSAPALIYRSEAQSRIWRVARPPMISNAGDPLRGVVIEQFGEDSHLVRQYMAKSATWNKLDATWTLSEVYIREIAPAYERPSDDMYHETLVCDFAEKPYQILSPGAGGRLDAMGTSMLYEYIKSGAGSREDRAKKRTEWHVRIARIFSCLVLVLLAIPSSVTFQRRGTMKGIGIAVLLAAFMLFLYQVFPSLGEAGIIQAWISAWIPNVLYTFIAIYIFRKNLAHRTFKEWLTARMRGES